MSRRNEQMAGAITDAVREVLVRGVNDPRVSGLITVTGATVADDLSEATVGISVLPAEKGHEVIEGLTAASGHIRREAGELVRVRRLPFLRFKLDDSLKKQLGLAQALGKVAAERHAREQKLDHGEAS